MSLAPRLQRRGNRTPRAWEMPHADSEASVPWKSPTRNQKPPGPETPRSLKRKHNTSCPGPMPYPATTPKPGPASSHWQSEWPIYQARFKEGLVCVEALCQSSAKSLSLTGMLFFLHPLFWERVEVELLCYTRAHKKEMDSQTTRGFPRALFFIDSIALRLTR